MTIYRPTRRAPRGMACSYCDAPASHWDHVVPRALGGRAGRNLVPACRRCGEAKADLDPPRLLDGAPDMSALRRIVRYLADGGRGREIARRRAEASASRALAREDRPVDPPRQSPGRVCAGCGDPRVSAWVADPPRRDRPVCAGCADEIEEMSNPPRTSRGTVDWPAMRARIAGMTP